MNIHHLELFYYVARHGGVSAATRHIPYGIQQPAVSSQVIQLENSLGTPLFTRRPFRLTRAGEELFAFVTPFFGELEAVARRLRGGVEVNLRIGALEAVQREYLPRVLQAVRRRIPELRFTLLPARLKELEEKLLAQEIDLAIAPLLGRRLKGIEQQELLQVPMMLLVPARSRIASAAMLWREDRIVEPLIAGAPEGTIYRLFQSELQKRKIEWYAGIELSSQELIARYVAEGFGFGLVLAEPGLATWKGVRALPLAGFAKVPYGVLWAGTLSSLQQTFLEEAQAFAEALSS
jgi:DNA-binding transcriptional LysR family regulator